MALNFMQTVKDHKVSKAIVYVTLSCVWCHVQPFGVMFKPWKLKMLLGQEHYLPEKEKTENTLNDMRQLHSAKKETQPE